MSRWADFTMYWDQDRSELLENCELLSQFSAKKINKNLHFVFGAWIIVKKFKCAYSILFHWEKLFAMWGLHKKVTGRLVTDFIIYHFLWNTEVTNREFYDETQIIFSLFDFPDAREMPIICCQADWLQRSFMNPIILSLKKKRICFQL